MNYPILQGVLPITTVSIFTNFWLVRFKKPQNHTIFLTSKFFFKLQILSIGDSKKIFWRFKKYFSNILSSHDKPFQSKDINYNFPSYCWFLLISSFLFPIILILSNVYKLLFVLYWFQNDLLEFLENKNGTIQLTIVFLSSKIENL